MSLTELLERAEPSRAIDVALAAGRRGDGRLLVIEGPPGIGKSRLLQEVRERAGSAQRVLFARASELERGFAFGVVRQLFEGVVRDPALAGSVWDGAAAAARDIFEERPGEEGAASFAVLHGLYWLALNLAEDGPLVLAVDDLHWCDASSLRFLAYLARRLDGTPILIAATTRPVTPAAVDAEPLADLLAEPSSVHLYPQALSQQGVGALLAEQLGQPVDDVFVRACFEATEGNPLMLRQLGRSLQAEGTEPTSANAASVRRVAHRALSRTVLARVGRHSAATVGVARAVAVLGDTATVPLVAELAGLDPGSVSPAWSELVDAEVLRREALAFVHALVRDAIYYDLPEPERQEYHLRAARLLAGAGGSVERIAGHLELAPRAGDPWVADIAVQAGEAALRRGAPDAAARHLQRAMDEPPPPDQRAAVMGRLAEALFDVDASAAIDLMIEFAALQTDPRARAAVEAQLVQALALTDRWQESQVRSAEAIERLGDDAPDLTAIFQSVRGSARMFGADAPGALEEVARHRTIAPGANLGERLRAGFASLWWTYSGGTAAECADLAARAIDSDPSILRDHTLIAVAPLYVLGLADREEGLDLWQRARVDAHRSGSVILHGTVDMWLGFTQQRRGDLTDSITGLTDALAMLASWGSGFEPLRFAHSALALAHMDAGDLTQARAVLDVAAEHHLPQHPSLGGALWWHAQAWVMLAEGRFDDALAATHAIEHSAGWISSPVGCDWHLPRALALHRLGEQDAALDMADRALQLAEHWGSPGLVGPALRIRSEIRGDEDLADLHRAVELLTPSSARIQLARTLIALGAALRRGRKPTEARAPLEQAFEIAGACGSPGLVEMARVELAASGVRRRPGEVAGAGALTPSERRVADLAAGGRTNREIAQELFVTPKTVEVHLSAAYRKLGIASRHALSGALSGAA